MGLVLSEKEEALGFSVMSIRAHATHGDIEAAGLERVHFVWEGDDHTVPYTTYNQHRLWLPRGDVGYETFGSFFPYLTFCPVWFCGLQRAE